MLVTYIDLYITNNNSSAEQSFCIKYHFNIWLYELTKVMLTTTLSGDTNITIFIFL